MALRQQAQDDEIDYVDATPPAFDDCSGNQVKLMLGDGTEIGPFDGFFPSFIEWKSVHPAPKLAATGARLISLTITHPESGALGWALAPFLDDDRVVIKKGDPGMRAEIYTPDGEKGLT